MFSVERTDKTFIKTCDGKIQVVLKRLVNLNCEKNLCSEKKIKYCDICELVYECLLQFDNWKMYRGTSR